MQITHDLQQDITGRHLIIVEDILDSGNTLAFLKEYFLTKGAASITIVTLLDKPSRRTKAITADLAGFTVGVVDKKKIIDGSRLEAGDVLLGVKSSGVHSNGFSLVRKVFGIGADDQADKEILSHYYDELGATLGETLLTPTRIYVKPVLAAIQAADIKAISHITGGGFYENIPRMLKEGLTAKIEKAAVPVLPIFEMIQAAGNIPERDMFNTFNMGVGLCVAVSKDTAQAALDAFAAAGEEAVVLGEVVEGSEGVILC